MRAASTPHSPQLLTDLAETDQAAFERCARELAYLANVLKVGIRVQGAPPSDVEARDCAYATCDRGLELVRECGIELRILAGARFDPLVRARLAHPARRQFPASGTRAISSFSIAASTGLTMYASKPACVPRSASPWLP